MMYIDGPKFWFLLAKFSTVTVSNGQSTDAES